MPKLLLAVANHGDSQLAYLERVLDNAETYSFETTVLVDTDFDMSGLISGRRIPITQRLLRDAVGYLIPYKHRPFFAENSSNYDFFLYTENDIFVPESAIDFIMKESGSLRDDEILGFCRYEVRENIKYLTDHDFSSPLTNYEPWSEGKHTFFTPFNLHFGCYLVSASQLKRAIASGGYLVTPHVGPYGVLEQGASDIYTQCGFVPKYLPLPIAAVLVHHMPNKYVNATVGDPRASRCPVELLSEQLRRIGEKPNLRPLKRDNWFKRAHSYARWRLRLFERSVRHSVRGAKNAT
jgi:hypothetical protein